MRAGRREDVDKVIEGARIKVKALLAVEDVMPSKAGGAGMAVTWNRIPPLMRKLTLPFLTLKDTLRLVLRSRREGGDERTT